MDATFDQAELFPVLERREARFSAYREFMEAVNKHGPLFPQAFIPLVLDVSQQRVSQLLEEDRIVRIQIRGKWFVPVASIEAYRADEKKHGRPVKELSFSDSMRKGLKKSPK